MRLRALRRGDPHLDEQRWRLTGAAVGVGGQVSFRLAPLVIAEVLVGLQQRCRVDGVKTKEADLRMLCNQLRRQQVATLADFVTATDDGTFRALCNAVTAHARRALATPETEVVEDEWDLVVFGQSGTVSFTQISQPWLRELTKRWAAADLPKRRSATFKPVWRSAITSAAWPGCRRVCGCAPTAGRSPPRSAEPTWSSS